MYGLFDVCVLFSYMLSRLVLVVVCVEMISSSGLVCVFWLVMMVFMKLDCGLCIWLILLRIVSIGERLCVVLLLVVIVLNLVFMGRLSSCLFDGMMCISLDRVGESCIILVVRLNIRVVWLWFIVFDISCVLSLVFGFIRWVSSRLVIRLVLLFLCVIDR